MSSFNDIVADAKSQIKNSVASSSTNIRSAAAGSLSSAKRDITGIVPGLTKQVINASGIRQALNVGTRSVSQAANQLIHGNVSGALETLSKGPSDIMGSLARSFGFGQGSTLTSPGAIDVSPGNSLNGILARADPLLSFQWYAEMPDISPLVGITQNLPWYYVEEATPAFRSFATRSLFREGRDRHYPSTYNVDPLNLVIYADSDNVALDYLMAWQGAILSETDTSNAYTSGGAYGRPKDYKKPIKIFLVNAAKRQIALFTYIECWPVTIDAYQLHSNSSDKITNHVNFSVGDVFVTFYDLSNTPANGFLPPTNEVLKSLAVAQQTLAIPKFELPSFT